MQDKYEFYGLSYFSKEVKADYYVEHTYDKNFNDKSIQTADQIAEAVAAYNAAQDQEKKVRREMASKGCDTFADSLKYHMTRKKVKVEDLSERSGLSDTTIKNYRSGAVPYPPIENVMAVCIGLNLHKPYCIDLLGTANYQITKDDPRSRAYRFCWIIPMGRCSNGMIFWMPSISRTSHIRGIKKLQNKFYPQGNLTLLRKSHKPPWILHEKITEEPTQGLAYQTGTRGPFFMLFRAT